MLYVTVDYAKDSGGKREMTPRYLFNYLFVTNAPEEIIYRNT